MASRTTTEDASGEIAVVHITPHAYTYTDLRSCRLISLPKLHDPFQEYILRKRLEALAEARGEGHEANPDAT